MANEKLRVQPNHEHYTACCSRMTAIKKISLRIMIITLAASAFMIILSLFGVDLSVLSIIPGLFGDKYSALYFFAQCFELIVMAIISILGCMRYKICDVILFVIYALMVIYSFLTHMTPAPMIIGGIGVIFSWQSISAMLDYNQLEETEGFPHFLVVLADKDDFRSQYEKQYHSSKMFATSEMPQADRSVEIPEFTRSKGEMLDLDMNSVSDNME